MTTTPAPVARLPQMPSCDDARAAAYRLGPPDEYVARVLDIAGARPLALDAMLRVSRVEWSSEVATACIECADRPRLLLNPAFVEARCHTPERLATLLLHELAHVSMGHTRLFPRPTFAHNAACDAIINREIAALAVERRGDLHALTALLVECYPADVSPWFLLRPPPGWPLAPDWTASRDAPTPLRSIHKRLYASVLPEDWHSVQYSEIVEALQKASRTSAVTANESTVIPMETLLGAHGTTALEQSALTGGRDALGAQAYAEALAPINGRMAGLGGPEVMMQVQRAARRAELERALRQLIRRCFSLDAKGTRFTWAERHTRTVMPHRDRRAPARMALARAFGAPPPLLFDDHRLVRQPEPQGATIYLDASGSMEGVLPALHAALVPLRRLLRPRILLFSTKVVEAGAEDFDAGRLRTTGGTNIDPVLEHLLRTGVPAAGHTSAVGNARRPQTALVLTDGYFTAPSAALCSQLEQRGIVLHLGVAGPGPLRDGASWVASATRLPGL
jgi:hypothetical protein